MTNPFARLATFDLTFPKPITANVFPTMETPTYWLLFHFPAKLPSGLNSSSRATWIKKKQRWKLLALVEASAWETLRTMVARRVIPCSVVIIVFAVGTLSNSVGPTEGDKFFHSEAVLVKSWVIWEMGMEWVGRWKDTTKASRFGHCDSQGRRGRRGHRAWRRGCRWRQRGCQRLGHKSSMAILVQMMRLKASLGRERPTPSRRFARKNRVVKDLNFAFSW